MKFLCLVYFEPGALAGLSPQEQQALDRESLAYDAELVRRQSGRPNGKARWRRRACLLKWITPDDAPPMSARAGPGHHIL